MKTKKKKPEVFDLEQASAQGIRDKIIELAQKKAELDRQIAINPLIDSSEELIEKTEAQSANRERSQYLGQTIIQLEEALEQRLRLDQQVKIEKAAEYNWEEFSKQARRTQEAIALAIEELEKLKAHAKAIASTHKKATGSIPLVDKIPNRYKLPQVEISTNKVMVHLSPQKFYERKSREIRK